MTRVKTLVRWYDLSFVKCRGFDGDALDGAARAVSDRVDDLKPLYAVVFASIFIRSGVPPDRMMLWPIDFPQKQRTNTEKIDWISDGLTLDGNSVTLA